MAGAQTSLPSNRTTRSGRSMATLAAFLIGLPLAGGLIALVHRGPLHDTPLHRYLSHPVECIEVTMFCCAMSALAVKFWQSRRERRAFQAEILPPWDGEPVPVSEAPKLFSRISQLPGSLQNTLLVNRVADVLDFVAQRGSAAHLDDHLRDRSDADSVVLDNSYALVRFITWAIPILGFLGTVLGITEAIAGVTPEVLENSLSTVTDGLALAFDSTAVALALTMVTMFFTFVVDRGEQNLLEDVDRYAARSLAHRFEQVGGEAGQVVEMVRHHAQVMRETTESLVRRQAEVWAESLASVEHRHAAREEDLHDRLTRALQAALDRTLDAHARRLAEVEERGESHASQLAERLGHVVATVKDQQAALDRTTESLSAHMTLLTQVQEGEEYLLRLQQTLARNLEMLAAAGTFDEAVHSLTAAVHLLTARASGATAGVVPAPTPVKRPGAAA